MRPIHRHTAMHDVFFRWHWRSLGIASGFTAFETPASAGGMHQEGREDYEGSLN